MNEYSLWADMLNKFHTSPEWIQVLWLLAVPLLLFGLFWCVKEVLVAFARQRQEAKGELLYSIYRNNDNELLVYHHAEVLGQAATDNMILFPATEKPEKYRMKLPGYRDNSL